MRNARPALLAAYPTPDETYAVLHDVSAQLGEDVCWLLDGAYHFRLAADWTLAIKPESAGRFRVAACERTAPRATVWTLGDRARLAALVSEISDAVQGSLNDAVEVQ